MFWCMKALAVWLSKQCVYHDIIEKDLFDWCVYSIEKRITSFLSRLLLLLVGFLFFGVIQSITFVICFFLIRKYTNGYHASTYWGCLLLSIFIEIICLTFAQFLPYQIAIITVCLSDVLIIIRAPSNNMKIHFDTAETMALKAKIRKCLLLMNCIYIVMMVLQFPLSNCIAMALLADAISLS